MSKTVETLMVINYAITISIIFVFLIWAIVRLIKETIDLRRFIKEDEPRTLKVGECVFTTQGLPYTVTEIHRNIADKKDITYVAKAYTNGTHNLSDFPKKFIRFSGKNNNLGITIRSDTIE